MKLVVGEVGDLDKLAGPMATLFKAMAPSQGAKVLTRRWPTLISAVTRHLVMAGKQDGA